MSESHEKPTIFIIQGAYHLPLPYEALFEGLKSRGYPTVHPRIPSGTDIGPTSAPVSILDDALAVRRELIRLIEDESKTVVVVMHSYGGVVGGEAVLHELSFASRAAKGLKGGVIHFFFFSAFTLDIGQSIANTFGQSPNDEITVTLTHTPLQHIADGITARRTFHHHRRRQDLV